MVQLFSSPSSLFLLYLRIFSTKSITRYFVYVGIAISAALYTATTIFLGVQCVLRPGELWMMPAVLARCSSTKVINYIHGIFGIISDLYIFILPMPILWKLHMPMRKKVGVMAIFATGLLYVFYPSFMMVLFLFIS